jgi:Zn-dependent protease with chaperone function
MYSQQEAFLKLKIQELAKKAKLKRVPELYISKNERLANVNIFQRRISVGEYLCSLWREDKFSDKDMEATLAHEIGHLMDFRRTSGSKSFRNLLIESLWFSFGVFPLVIYLLSPSFLTLAFSALFAIGWSFSIPWVVKRIEVQIELVADQNAALFLVEPQQLASTLVKISSFGVPTKKFGLSGRLSFLASTITHPSFNERVQNLLLLKSTKKADCIRTF